MLQIRNNRLHRYVHDLEGFDGKPVMRVSPFLRRRSDKGRTLFEIAMGLDSGSRHVFCELCIAFPALQLKWLGDLGVWGKDGFLAGVRLSTERVRSRHVALDLARLGHATPITNHANADRASQLEASARQSRSASTRAPCWQCKIVVSEALPRSRISIGASPQKSTRADFVASMIAFLSSSH